MASFTDWTDAEISKKLKEIGITIPVTSSTRGILIKKLENNLSGKSTSPSPRATKTRQSYSLAQYSSGEESDNEKHGRSIAAKSMPPPPAVKARNTRRQTLASPPSYSPPAVVQSPAKTRGRFSMATAARTSSLTSPSRVSYDENGSDSDSIESPSTSKHSPRVSDMNGSESQVSSLLSYRKQPTPKTESPFLSDFTRRLAEKASRESRKVGSLLPRTSELFKEKDTDELDDFIARHSRLNSLSAARDSGSPATSDLSQQFKTEEAPRLFSNSQAISMVLLLFACIFFFVLGVAYLNIRDNQPFSFSSENTQNTYPTCTPDMLGDHNDATDALCILPEQLVPATRLMRHLHPELVRRAVQAQCGPPERDGSYVSPLMTERQLVQWLSRKTDLEDWQCIRDLRNLKKILLANAHWNIEVVAAAPTPSTADARGLEDNHILVGNGGLRAVHVDLPWACLARLKLVSAASTLVLVVIGAFAAYGGKRLWSWRSERQKRGRQEVFSLVQRILSVLQTHHASLPPPGSPGSPGTGGHGCLAINHVRDQLIAPQHRDSMAGVWQQAVDFLERNESRVRAEVQEVAGEECPVWRWLPPASPPATPNVSPSCGSLPGHDPLRAKLWQGQAFVTEPGAQNGAPSSPTPCLKLRHMFDPGESGEGWRSKVTDALLEKCGEGVDVLHVAFEPRSPEGLVYMKCATLEDAGIAYRAVHGWWFDSKLVTVKYIRLERYHERFPDARDATAPLKPSNNKKLSLSNSFWQLPLDGN